MKTIRVAGLVMTLTLAGALAALAVDAERLDSEVGAAMQTFRAANPRIGPLFDSAYGYAIFPSVGKGAIGVGGAEGQGEVYEKGVLMGRAKLTQVTVGAQLGAQSYAEVIFFESPRALDEFKDGKTALSAGLSGAVASDGGGAEAKYQHGVLVYTVDRSGLMFEASIGGQHFAFRPIDAGGSAPAATESSPAGTATPPSAPATPPAETPPQPPAQ
jgi:lipid-binding SYLF domain-containing protein